MDKKPGQRASLCKEYASTGSCRLGDKCRFSHGNVDDIHRDRGKQLCPHFTQGRVCNYGASCRYSHDATSRQPTAITGLQLRERVKALLSSPELTTDISVLYAREVEQAAPLVALRRPDIRSLGRIDEYRVGVFLSAGLHQLATDSHTFLLDIDEKSSVWATLRELIEHTEYVCASQSGRIVVSTATSATPLSFQRCMVPLMFIVGHPALERSSLSKAVNYLLSPIANSLLPFLTTYTACVAELLDKGTLSDNLCPVVKPGQFSPVSFAQVFLPLAKCLELVFSRFVEVTRNKTVKEALAHVDTLVQRWHDKVQGNELSTVEVPYAVNIVRATLEQATRCFADSVSFEDQIRARREQLQAYERAVEAEKGAMVPLWKGDQLHPPAQIHSNDKLMYREISILPTMDEIFCTEPPTLPGNCQYESAAHWLGPGPERLLDTHFRLLRHDMVSSLKASVAAFVDTLRKSYKRSTSSTPPALEHSGRLKLQGRNTTDLMVYSGVHCTGVINTGDRGQSVAVAFQLPESSNGRSSASFWEKCLLRDGLVCLIYQHDVGDAAANTADITHGIAFAVITDRDDPQSRAQRRPADSNAPQITFWEHPGHAHKQKGAILLNFGDRTLPQELWNTRNSSQHTSRRSTRQSRVYMIEARNVLYESYRPVLEALQLKKASDIPFSNILCPEELPTAPIHVPPPLYTQAPGFSFDLTFLTPDGTSPGPDMLRLQPTDGDQVIECQEKLQQYTTLDASQSHALVQALSSTVSAIQGPPGTGKSFIGVKIVQAIHRLDTDTVYPILVVCYTNHALDQFLENLLDVGIHSIARIGSKMSDRLKEYRADRWSDRSLREKVKDLQQQLTEYSSELAALQTASKNNINDPTMRDVFKAVLPLHHEAINRRHHARFQTRGSAFDYWYQGWDLGDADKSPFSRSDKRAARKGERLEDKNKFSALAHIDGDDQTDEAIAKAAHKNVKQPRPVEELVADNNLWDMPGPERIKLGRHIIATVLTAHAPRIQALQAQIAKIHAELQDTQIVRMVEALRNKKVIGMTTTGAAKQCKALQALQPKIILCEEAGEVLEAHILALLGSYVQQLVLIGDHQQLRPKVDAYELSAAHSSHYRLDISLFERLIVPESARQCHVLPHVTLTQQRRMRPVISQFVRQSGVYKNLTDGPNTLDYPDVVGVAKNVFFLAHNEPQETKQDAFTTVQSHVNPFEVEMSAALVKYMLQQDYKPGQIVVLTPYLGQLQRIRQELLRMSLLTQIDDRDRKQLDLVYTEDEIASNEVLVKDLNLGQSVRVSTVDNYQGEEADIIIISLVRSHFADGSDRGIGFVKLDNRVTVLLSRARHGMFLLGNADLFQEKSSPLWTTVLDLMSEQGLIGPAFPAMCAKHPEHRPTIQKASDFALFMPDGGCLEACDFRLPCGHACLRKCHRDNSDHAQLRCRRPCSRLHPACNHICPKECGETCGRCEQTLPDDLVLPCGHSLASPRCWQAQDPTQVYCPQLVQATRFCGHTVPHPCGQQPDSAPCPSKCGDILSCGHSCLDNCAKCKRKPAEAPDEAIVIEHKPCKQPCSKVQPCRHICGVKCAKHPPDGLCEPCKKPCNATECDHSRCPKYCSEPCMPCIEKCRWACTHGIGTCILPCGAPCIRVPCDRRCDRYLGCGHQCPSLCGEPCPDTQYCHSCASDGVKEQRVDLIMGETYAETDIDEHPVIVLKCGHIFTVETLDGMLGLANYYNKLGNQWVDAKLLPDESENNSLPACPDCRAPILTCNARRYGRVIKQAVLVLANKYTVSDFRTKLTALQQSIDEIPAMIEGIQTMPVQQMKTRGRPVDPRIKRTNKIQATISTLRKRLRNVRKEIIDNATRKLYDACQRALKQKQRRQALERTNIVRQYTVDEGTTQFLEGHLDAHTMTLRFSAQAQEAYRLFISALRHYDHAVDLFKRGQASTRMMQIKIAQLALYKSYLLLQWQYRDSTKFAGLSPEKQKVWLDATSALNDEAVRFTSQVDKDTIDIRARAREYGDYDCDRALQEYQAYFTDSKARCDRGLAPSMSEIKAIVAVLQDIPGGATRWYTCPNGHYYAVGDCGGVVTEGRCMECGAAIGGTSYALREGNRSAHGL